MQYRSNITESHTTDLTCAVFCQESINQKTTKSYEF